LRAIARTIGTFCRPLKPFLEWAACELRFGELMGVAILTAAVVAYLAGWVGFLLVVAAYVVALVGTSLLQWAIAVAESELE
jgi:Flp pilus assembly protein TadB